MSTDPPGSTRRLCCSTLAGMATGTTRDDGSQQSRWSRIAVSRNLERHPPVNNPGYTQYSSASMPVPYASGLLALLRSQAQTEGIAGVGV